MAWLSKQSVWQESFCMNRGPQTEEMVSRQWMTMEWETLFIFSSLSVSSEIKTMAVVYGQWSSNDVWSHLCSLGKVFVSAGHACLHCSDDLPGITSSALVFDIRCSDCTAVPTLIFILVVYILLFELFLPFLPLRVTTSSLGLNHPVSL